MADLERCSPVSADAFTSTTVESMADNEDNNSSVDIKEKEDDTQTKISFKVPGGMPKFIPPKQTVKQEETPTLSKLDTDNKQDSDSTDSRVLEEEIQIEGQSESKKTAISSLSPAEQLKTAQVVFPYKEPAWSGLCEEGYQFEVLKNGSIIDNIDLTKKPFHVFGRLPSCDVTMEHPSLSRHHAVMQYSTSAGKDREKGWYLYDLDSTHGTWINKAKIRPKVYNRVRVGHVVKFGGSSRLHILQGPEDDKEEETELSVTELMEQKEKQKKEAEVLHQAELLEQETRLQKEKQRMEDRGCTWGIDEDAVEPSEENPFIPASVIPQNEHLYIDDPKKALKGYFEREGYDLPEYQFVDCGPGKHKCTVELPVDTPTGEPVIAEVVVSGKRKDAVVACALEACRLLDKHGELRKSKHESHKRKAKNWEENDFYDSDEDTFLDRTGTIEKKRVQRMKRAGKMEDKLETYESLLERHTNVAKEITDIEAKLNKAKADAAAFEDEEIDALDAYMSAIKSGVMDTKTKMSLKRQLIELRQEEHKLRRLVNVAKPATLPELKLQPKVTPKPVVTAPASTVGKIHKGPKKQHPVPSQKMQPVSQDDDGVEEEEEDDDEDKSADTAISSSNSTNTKKSAKAESVSSTVSSSSSRADNAESITRLQESGRAEPDSTSGKVRAPVVKGPAMPPPSSVTSSQQSGLSEVKEVRGPSEADHGPDSTKSVKSDVAVKAVKRSSAGEGKMKSKKKKTSAGDPDYDMNDPDYAVWMPPVGQSGDGKTHLNDKYGY